MYARKLALSDDWHYQCFYHEEEKVNSKNRICAISIRVVSEHNKESFLGWEKLWLSLWRSCVVSTWRISASKGSLRCLNVTYNVKLMTVCDLKCKYLCRIFKSGQIMFGEIQKWRVIFTSFFLKLRWSSWTISATLEKILRVITLSSEKDSVAGQQNVQLSLSFTELPTTLK